MTIRPKIQEIFENADKFKLRWDELSFKEGVNEFIINPRNKRGITKTYIRIKKDGEIEGSICLNEEESDLLNPIFSLVYESRQKEKEEEDRKYEYKKHIAYFIKKRKEQIEFEKLLNETDFTKQNTIDKKDEESNGKEENKKNE